MVVEPAQPAAVQPRRRRRSKRRSRARWSSSANDDRPGVIGEVGTVLGRHGVNIASFALGRDDARRGRRDQRGRGRRPGRRRSTRRPRAESDPRSDDRAPVAAAMRCIGVGRGGSRTRSPTGARAAGRPCVRTILELDRVGADLRDHLVARRRPASPFRHHIDGVRRRRRSWRCGAARRPSFPRRCPSASAPAAAADGGRRGRAGTASRGHAAA